jgi:hypothetical protein
MQFPVDHDRDRIPSKPTTPFQCRHWSLYARVALGEQFHVYLRSNKGRNGHSLSEPEIAGCDGYHMRSDFSLGWNWNRDQRTH